MTCKRVVFDDDFWAHFVTFNCYRRRGLLSLDLPKKILLGVLNQQLQLQKASCIGFVVMPNHVHAILWFPLPGNLSKFMQGWKRKSSYQIRSWYRDADTRYFNAVEIGDKFWQPKYYSFEIDNRVKMKEKLTYMHMNPVRSGLVDRAVDWKWSSARWYANRQSVGVQVDWIDC